MKADVVIFGGTSAGVIAACTATRAGYSVILVEPGRHIGGLSSGGFCIPERFDPGIVSGMAREFYQRVGRVYSKHESFIYEPCAAEAVFHDLLRDHNINVLNMSRLQDVRLAGGGIERIIVQRAMTDEFNAPGQPDDIEDVEHLAAKVYIDCSYEGDLLALAGVSCEVDPPQPLGMRLCLTTNTPNMRPFPNIGELSREAEKELLADAQDILTFRILPNDKSEVRIAPAAFVNLPEAQQSYLLADSAERARIWRAHIHRVAAMVRLFSTHPSLSDDFRETIGAWGFCTDEFHTTAGWPHTLHQVARRRMVSEKRLDAADLSPRAAVNDPIARAGEIGAPIPYRSIVPQRNECSNLIVPTALSCTPAVDDVLTCEPTVMTLANSAALAGVLSIKRACPVQDVDVVELEQMLTSAGVELEK